MTSSVDQQTKHASELQLDNIAQEEVKESLRRKRLGVDRLAGAEKIVMPGNANLQRISKGKPEAEES